MARPAPKPSNASLDQALERLKTFHPKSMDLSLGRIERLLAALGHPEQTLPPVFHIAGTNGKGSTIAFLRALLEASGQRVHVYTSPHLVHFNERIRLAGHLIEDDHLLALIEEVERVNDGKPITFFEMTTAIAFLAFARVPADAVLLETGLGGRLDATNVITPAVTGIARISFDHMHLLGDTLAAIAGEKAGIFKPGVPAVIGYQASSVALQTLQDKANAIDAPLFVHGRDWFVHTHAHGFRYEDRDGSLDLPHPALLGPHQIHNAGLALACLRQANSKCLTQPIASKAMNEVEWPGRLQRLTTGPLVAGLSPDTELWLDGGHNDSGGEVLAAQAALWRDKPLSLVFGMLNTKQPEDFLRPLLPYIDRMATVTIPDEPLSLSADETATVVRRLGLKVNTCASVEEAIQTLASGPNPQRLLICGSLYLAGSVLKTNN